MYFIKVWNKTAAGNKGKILAAQYGPYDKKQAQEYITRTEKNHPERYFLEVFECIPAQVFEKEVTVTQLVIK